MRHSPRLLARLVAASVIGLGALSCAGDGPTQPPVAVALVELDGAPASGVVLVGGTANLTATPRSAEGSPLSRSVSWTSSNTAVATVNAAGVVSGLSAGPVAIIATAGGVQGVLELSIRVPVAVPAAGAPAPTTTSVLGGAVSLTIPPGATATTQLTVAPAADVPEDDRILAGTTFDFGPSGTAFSSPVTMALRFNPAAVPAGRRSDLRIHRVETNGDLTLLPGGAVDLTTQLVSAPVSSFSTYTLVLPPQPTLILVEEGQSQLGMVGQPLSNIAVVLRDAQGRPVPLVNVEFTVQSGGGSIQGATSVESDAAGVARLPGTWTMGPAKGQNTLRAAVVGAPLAVLFTATAVAPPTQIVVLSSPTASLSGVALPEPIIVEVRDDFNERVDTYFVPVTATLVEGTGTLEGTTSEQAATGGAIFQGLRVNGVGPHRIAFTSGALVADTADVITVTQELASLAILTQPAGATSGVAFTTQPVVELRDHAGLRMQGATSQVVASAVHGPGVPFGSLTAQAVYGVETFAGLAIEGPGAQSLRFGVGNVTVISDEFVVGPPPPGVRLLVTDAPLATYTPGQSFGIPIQFDLSNAAGANLASVSVTVTWDPARFDYLDRGLGPWNDSENVPVPVTADESNVANGVLTLSGTANAATTSSFRLGLVLLTAKATESTVESTIGATVTQALNISQAAVPVTVRPVLVTILVP
jgi:uncharacterized lipoprotein YbaY